MFKFRLLAHRVRAAYARVRNFCGGLKPAQLVSFGFFSYVVCGVLLLTLPFAQKQSVNVLDNLFNVTSAMSTTGLTTVSVADFYTFFGQFVLMCLFQLGGIGYMTITSFVVLVRGKKLSDTRVGVLSAEFALPHGLELGSFLRNVVLFTTAIEVVGAALLYMEFRSAGIERPLWSAIFHSVSAFATAGFSLNNDSLEQFQGNWLVCLTIGCLSYGGAIGFIVIQDAWRAARSRAYQITFTSKVILTMTAIIFAVGVPLLWAVEPLLREMPIGTAICAAMFQIMTASSTAGFNTVPIISLSTASLTLIIVAMVIGASPSGTGGGIKTTSLSSLLAIAISMLRGRKQVAFFQHEIPLPRLFTATAAATMYLLCLTCGLFLLCLTERQDFLKLVFEASSALGTVGLSMGITSDLTWIGKIVVILLMFVGRVGPLTMGLAFFHRPISELQLKSADLAV